MDINIHRINMNRIKSSSNKNKTSFCHSPNACLLSDSTQDEMAQQDETIAKLSKERKRLEEVGRVTGEALAAEGKAGGRVEGGAGEL